MEMMEYYQPAVPSYFGGSLLKVRAVITAATKSEKFRAMLEEDTRRAVASSGVDMSEQELLAVEDIVTGSNNSLLSKVSAEFVVDEMKVLHFIWCGS